MFDLIWAGFALLAGAAVGSFLNVVADRLPSGGSIVHPRSFCGSCQQPLGNLELIPVVSYLLLRGKCRRCQVSIPARFTVVEVVTALLFVLVYLKYGMGVQFFILATAVSLMIAISVMRRCISDSSKLVEEVCDLPGNGTVDREALKEVGEVLHGLLVSAHPRCNHLSQQLSELAQLD